MPSASIAQEFSLALRVYIEDTDAGGIVYYVNYLKFLERARTEFMRTLGCDRNTIFNSDIMFVVRDVQIEYLQPALLDDELLATVAPLRIGGASMLLAQSVKRGDELLAKAEIKIACVDKATVLPKRIPAEMLAKLRQAANS